MTCKTLESYVNRSLDADVIIEELRQDCEKYNGNIIHNIAYVCEKGLLYRYNSNICIFEQISVIMRYVDIGRLYSFPSWSALDSKGIIRCGCKKTLFYDIKGDVVKYGRFEEVDEKRRKTKYGLRYHVDIDARVVEELATNNGVRCYDIAKSIRRLKYDNSISLERYMINEATLRELCYIESKKTHIRYKVISHENGYFVIAW